VARLPRCDGALPPRCAALVHSTAALKWHQPRPIAADMAQHMSKPEQQPRRGRPHSSHTAALLAVACAAAIVVVAALTDPRLLTLMLVGGVLAAMARGRS
jgi:Flp pilus assembly protein TadB